MGSFIDSSPWVFAMVPSHRSGAFHGNELKHMLKLLKLQPLYASRGALCGLGFHASEQRGIDGVLAYAAQKKTVIRHANNR
jgi:hypothetical protein